MRVWTPFMARCTQYTIMSHSLSGWLFSPGTLVFSTNKTDCHDITEILLKVVLNTITLAHVLMIIFPPYFSLLLLYLPFLVNYILHVLLVFNDRILLYALLIFDVRMICWVWMLKCSCMIYWCSTLECSWMFYWIWMVECSFMFHWFLNVLVCFTIFNRKP